MKIEKEARFYFPHSELTQLIFRLKKLVEYSYSNHEVTIMYDNPNPDFSFYTPSIDGRLRLRHTHPIHDPRFGQSQPRKVGCMVTWKRRLPNQQAPGIRHEEEIEFSVNSSEAAAVTALLENVLHCKRVSSYERRRHFFHCNHIEATLDEFPYGLMLEFELKDTEDEVILMQTLADFGLDAKGSSSLSCDDKYFELCQKKSITIKPDIVFSDTTMPLIQ
ncbi:MAG TPA: hypothetical protein VNG90_00505 [Candidatus Acidoferrum sp.]|nr:hypothetical protein [Candidatus Acidoferrum sp.]